MLGALVNSVPARAQSAPVAEPEAAGRSLHDVMRVVIKTPCFDQDSLADQVEHWLGRDTVNARVRSIQLRASQGVMSFSIDVAGQPATVREFEELPRDCTEQRGAIALSIALAVDALETDLPVTRAPSPPAFMASAQGLLSTGVPTSFGLGGGFGLEARAGSILALRMSLIGATSMNDQTLTDAHPFRYSTRLLIARGDLCLRGKSSRGWHMAGCAGYWIGDLRAASDTTHSSHLWYAVSLGAELRWTAASGLGFLVGIDVIAPLRHVRVQWEVSPGPSPAWRDFPDALGALRVGPTYTF